MLITLERFLVIKFPFKAKQWFTSRKTTTFGILAVVTSIFINVPRFLLFQVQPNQYQEGTSSITEFTEFSYLIGYSSVFGWNAKCLFEKKLGDFHSYLDFMAPLPFLLVFNTFSYLKVSYSDFVNKNIDHKFSTVNAYSFMTDFENSKTAGKT